MGFNNFEDTDFMATLLDTMADGVMIVDRAGKIISLNRAAEVMTGYSNEEIAGKPCSLLDTDRCSLVSHDGKEIKCTLFKRGHVKNKQCRIKTKDGKRMVLLKNASLLRDRNGEVIGAVETMTDVTSLVMKEIEIETLRQELTHEYGFMGLIGKSPSMKKVYEQIENVASSDLPVIILGESGTGKELVAEAIHKMSKRNRHSFIKVNCAALNEYLLESELFGHRRGSFTGALKDRQGRFEAADRGSIFLDEIGDMPLSMQVKLLRVLQEKEVERVGENHSVKVDVRVITATNKNITDLLKSGKFREDLFYRINVFPVSLPPLRDRRDDLPLLIAHYLQKISIVNQKEISGLTPPALELLYSYDWPGNIRELINVLEYGAISCGGNEIERDHLPEFLSIKEKKKRRDIGIKDDEAERVLDALRVNNFNRTKTANSLGISRVALWKKMKRLGISV